MPLCDQMDGTTPQLPYTCSLTFASYGIGLLLVMIVALTFGQCPIWDIVDRCRVWESHADSDARRFSKPGPDTVNESGCRTDDQIMAAVTTSQTAAHQLETLLRRLLPDPVVPSPPPSAFKFGAVVTAKTGSSDIKSLLQSLLPRTLASMARMQPGPMQRDWSTVVCSCSKAGHGVTRCPDLNEAFLFMLPGWKAEKVGGGYVMISPPCGSGTSPGGIRRLIRGGGSAARISNGTQSQDHWLRMWP